MTQPIRLLSALIGILLVGFCLGFGFCLGYWPSLEEASALPQPDNQDKPKAFQLAGSNSCSGRGCHGNLDPRPGEAPKGSEYSIWSMHDPHTRAFTVLKNPLSEQIVKRLGLGNACQEVRCLACHVTPQAAENDILKPSERTFGVGCESCHGAAEKWLQPHTQKTEWAQRKKELGPEGLEREFGYVDLKNISKRSSNCVGCHIGAPADPVNGIPLRDMNHDMIAAGHPRLVFEMQSYQASIPKHWEETEEMKTHAARLWSVGQVVSLRAALKLMTDRASHSDRPWPEFSQHDCYACHHDLAEPSWRQWITRPKDVLGVTPLNDWIVAMPRMLFQSSDQHRDLSASLQNLESILHKRLPNKNSAIQAASQLDKQLEPLARKLESLSWEETERNQLRSRIAQYGQGDALRNWDATSQAAYAIYAFEPTLPEPAKSLLRALEIPSLYDSPRQYEKNRSQDRSQEQIKKLFLPFAKP